MTAPIYLDNNMTARPSAQVMNKMIPLLTECWGHPSQPHRMGQKLYPYLEESFKAIYAMLGAHSEDAFVFTSSGAEAVNHVISSVFHDYTRTTGKNHFITSTIDEAPAIMSIGRLEELGCMGKMVIADKSGKITAENIADTLSPRTVLVSLSWANGMTGVVNPVAEIAKLCKEREILLHLDATHVLGKLFYDPEEMGASFVTFNGDQLHAPRGTGGLWIKRGIKCSPFILGGIEQGGRRAGSYNIPALVGLGSAAVELIDNRDLLCTEITRLRNQFECAITSSLPDAVIFFQSEERLPHCTAIGFPGVANEALLYALNKRGLYASIGGGSFQQIGLILAASGIDKQLTHTALHFSLSYETTEEEVDRAADIVVDTVKKLSKLSRHLLNPNC